MYIKSKGNGPGYTWAARLWISLVLACFFMTAGAQTKDVTLDVTGESIANVLDAIQRQTSYHFFYNKGIIDLNDKVSLKADNEPVETVLNRLFADKGISYTVEKSQIVLRKSDSSTQSASDNTKVSGVVTDSDGEPLMGATVMLKGTNTGVSTNLDGEFILPNVKIGDELSITYIGCHPETVKIRDNSPLKVVLKAATTNLDEVVVIGYGVQKKRDVTTAISSVSGKDLADMPANSIEQALVGRMPGVQITQGTGMPGGGTSIKVRGTGTVTAGSEPLYVIDGIPLSESSSAATGTQINPLGGIDMNDVESIEVLKDASAASIYGSRGANGVVIITTKNGASGKPKVSYNGFVGWQQTTKKIDMMGAYDLARLIYESHNNAYLDLCESKGIAGSITDSNAKRLENMLAKPTETNVTYTIPDEIVPYLNGEKGLTDTDWQDAIFRNALTTKHSLSVSGGSNGVNYFISGNYAKEDGIVIGSGQETFGGRANINVKYNRVTFGANTSISHMVYDIVATENRFSKETVVASALSACPFFPVYNDDGSYNFGNYNWSYKQQAVLNPVALALERKDKMKRNKILGKVFFGWEIIDNLKFKTEFSANINNYRREVYRPSTIPNSTAKVPPSNPEGTVRTKDALSWTWENTLSYNRQFGRDHELSAVLGQSMQRESLEASRITGNGYPNDLVTTLNAATTATAWDSGREGWSLASVFARAQYNYKRRYLLSASLRADGSSRFGQDNRWGYFPAFSAGWYLSEENFLKSQTWLDALKIRASYGVSGNFSIGNYEYYSELAQDNYIYGSGKGTLVSGLYPSTIANKDLGWEKTAMTNIGLEFGAFNMLRIEVDLYNSNTSDMLLDVPVPYLTGFDTSLQNRGKVNNKGFEISLSTYNRWGDWKWNNSFNFAMNRNKVVDLGNVDEIITLANSVIYYRTKVGHPIGDYYTLVTDGIFRNEEELAIAKDLNDKRIAYVAGAKVGDLKFVDQNGDGVINDDDKAVTGNYAPDFTYGYSTQLMYKWFDLSISLQGVYGNEIAYINKRYIDSSEGSINCMSNINNRYVDANNPGDGYTCRANRSATGKNGTISTWHIEDGSYLRCRDITFGVTMPRNWMKKLGVDNCRLYFTAYNPFTITNFSGYNPEVSISDNPLTPGMDYGTYPLAKSYIFGLNVSF